MGETVDDSVEIGTMVKMKIGGRTVFRRKGYENADIPIPPLKKEGE